VELVYATANLRTKIVMSIITAAGAFTTRDKLRTHFFPSIEEAMDFARTLRR
jgi:hypothetical protein